MPTRRAIVTAFVAGLIAIAAGIALSYQIHWFPVQASTQAKNTDTLYHVLVIASIPIFVLVVAVILFSVWQFRMRPGEDLEDGPPIHGNTRLEVFWTAIPAMILLGLVSYSFVVLHENEKKPAGVPEIQIGVTGQQFFWDYEYPSSVTGGKPLKSYQLYLPKGDTVYFNMRSKDVIHAFWIPGVPPAGGRGAGHHDPLPGDARPPRHLSGRVQPAVRRRALADALGRARRPAGPVPGVAGRAGALGLECRHGLRHPAGERRAARRRRGSRCGIMRATMSSSHPEGAR